MFSKTPTLFICLCVALSMHVCLVLHWIRKAQSQPDQMPRVLTVSLISLDAPASVQKDASNELFIPRSSSLPEEEPSSDVVRKDNEIVLSKDSPQEISALEIKEANTKKHESKSENPIKPRKQAKARKRVKKTDPTREKNKADEGSLGSTSSAAAGSHQNTDSGSVGQEGIIAAAYRMNAMPQYPEESRRRKEQGTVRLEVLVGANGKAIEVKVFRTSGFPRLDQSAVDAVKKWEFIAATKNGEKVDAWYRLKINFKLRK